MVIYSMSISVDGFIADRDGAFDWSGPSDEQFRFHLAEVRGLGAYLMGRRLYVVDELHMFRYPVVVGGGTPFLPPVTDAISLDLIDTRTFGSRVVYECYRHVRDSSD
jgi:dihydrofolate reductase